MSDAPSDRTNLAHLRHDLRTPLNQIIGYTELLIEEATEANHVSYTNDLTKIRGAATTLLGLINENLKDDRLTLRGEIVGPSEHATSGTVAATSDSSFVASDTPAAIAGHILVVDDNAENRDVLVRQLERQGHRVTAVGDGKAALQTLRGASHDLVLLDMIMPELGGYETLVEIKRDPALQDLPVIMISALDELGSVVRCIERGAEDYLPKPFNPTLLRARIGAGLAKKRFRDQERHYLATIEQTQKRLQAELTEAEKYVRSTLPSPLTSGSVRVDWRLVPSTELGGDSFGYHWIDADHFAIYLLDVCGHGVGAALLSVAAINVLKTGALPGVDFRDPGRLLTALNEAFLMERQNDMYFTVWYGVWQPSTRTLRFATAGHPPALLATAGPQGRRTVAPIRGPGMILGGMSGVVYQSLERKIPSGAQLYVLSDGTFEIANAQGVMWTFAEFQEYFTQPGEAAAGVELDRLLEQAKARHGPGALEDDFSIMRVDL